MKAEIWNYELWQYYFDLSTLRANGKPMTPSQVAHLEFCDGLLKDNDNCGVVVTKPNATISVIVDDICKGR